MHRTGIPPHDQIHLFEERNKTLQRVTVDNSRTVADRSSQSSCNHPLGFIAPRQEYVGFRIPGERFPAESNPPLLAPEFCLPGSPVMEKKDQPVGKGSNKSGGRGVIFRRGMDIGGV